MRFDARDLRDPAPGAPKPAGIGAVSLNQAVTA